MASALTLPAPAPSAPSGAVRLAGANIARGQPPTPADWIDQRAVDIASGLRIAVEDLARVVIGPEAGPESGEVYYTADFDELGVAVRHDGMSMFLTWLAPHVLTPEAASALLHRHRLVAGNVADLSGIPRSDPTRSRPTRSLECGPWLHVAFGKPSVPGSARYIDFSRPGRPDESLAFETLNLLSSGLQRLLRSTSLHKADVEEVRAVAVVPGTVIGRSETTDSGQNGTDVFGRTATPPITGPDFTIRPGTGVMLSDHGEYLSTGCGYIMLDAGLLSVLPPLWIDPDQMEVFWLALDTEPPEFGADAMLQALTDHGIVHGIRMDEIHRVVGQLRERPTATGAFLVAAGTRSAASSEAEILVDTKRGSGRMRADGSIDFLGVEVVPTVKAGHLLARRVPENGVAASTVKGHAPASDRPPKV